MDDLRRKDDNPAGNGDRAVMLNAISRTIRRAYSSARKELTHRSHSGLGDSSYLVAEGPCLIPMSSGSGSTERLKNDEERRKSPSPALGYDVDPDFDVSS